MNGNKFIIVIILAVLFGLGGGVVGEILARVYIFENTFGIPLFGEINYSNNSTVPNLIIRQAQKVVVEQNTMLAETAKSMAGSLAGIHLKHDSQTKANVAKDNSPVAPLSDYYQVDQPAGQGIIITSDGWIVSAFVPEELKVVATKASEIEKTKQLISRHYVVITQDRKIYDIDSVYYDKVSAYSFWHISANDLSVKPLAQASDLNNGQSIFALNLNGWTWPTTITGLANQSALIKSSDVCQGEAILAQTPNANLQKSFLFTYGGAFIGFVSADNKFQPIYNYTAQINSFLKTKESNPALLGLNYMALSKLATTDKYYEKGALIAGDKNNPAIIKGSPAEQAGLKAGDVIVAVNGINIDQDNDLCSLISQQKAGAEITLKFLRAAVSTEIKVVLGKL